MEEAEVQEEEEEIFKPTQSSAAIKRPDSLTCEIATVVLELQVTFLKQPDFQFTLKNPVAPYVIQIPHEFLDDAVRNFRNFCVHSFESHEKWSPKLIKNSEDSDTFSHVRNIRKQGLNGRIYGK